ncbi:MAG TPA: hypothetical protein ENJ00_08620 [Phycisphaerales bacterium]|nr:hypothetical protein [Phycisphaerales bacterium]
MGFRLLAILLLIAPTLQGRSLPVSSRCGSPSTESAMVDCGMGMAEDGCGCCAAPADDRRPDEPIPMPTRTGDLLIASIPPAPTPTTELDWSIVPEPAPAEVAGQSLQSHNVVQALLGIWRT